MLVVEDNDINREIVVSALSAAQIVCETAVDGQHGVEAVVNAEAPFDAVLMDMQMPRMDGLEATRAIRATHPDLPIVGVTANALADARGQCLDAGMNDVVTKPIHMDLLFATLQRLAAPVRAVAQQIDPARAATGDDGATEIPALPGIDVADGLARSGGNVTLYRDLLRRFADGHADGATVIRDALERDDREEADRTAHTLKGVAGNIGARGVHEPAGRLRQVIERASTNEAEALIAQLDAQLRAIVAGMRDALTPPPKGESADVGDDDSVDLTELGSLIAASDTEALDWLDAHRRALERAWGAAVVSTLASALDVFDFERASQIVSAQRQELDRVG